MSTPDTAFLSHSSGDSEFVVQVAGYLTRCFGRIYCYEEWQRAGNVVAKMQEECVESTFLIFFIGSATSVSNWQREEVNAAQKLGKKFVVVQLPDGDGNRCEVPGWGIFTGNVNAIRVAEKSTEAARKAAEEICRRCNLTWQGADGLPAEPNLFSYEKQIIDFYVRLRSGKIDDPEREADREMVLKGCSLHWPTVPRRAETPSIENKLVPKVGEARKDDACVRVKALESATECGLVDFTFPEAGPREYVCFPKPERDRMKVAVLVVGGIAPGINAVIDGIVQRHYLYATEGGYGPKLDIYGLLNGVEAFKDWDNSHRLLVNDSEHHKGRNRRLETPQHAHEGGSILGTCRDDELIKEATRHFELDRVVRRLNDHDILYVIGGDGGMRLAHAIRSYAIHAGRTGDRELTVVGIPKTMDNDILWVWQSFGFMSAVEKAREVIEHIHTEVTSNPRLGIVQLFGSVSGFVVSHAVLAGSTPDCYLALVPEVAFKLREVAGYLRGKLNKHAPLVRGLIVMAESALPEDALEVLAELREAQVHSGAHPDPILTDAEENAVNAYLQLGKAGKTLSGQTSDHLRTACLKLVSKGLEFFLKRYSLRKGDGWEKLRVVTNEPRHIIRAIPPSCQDIITGRRLGSLAVDNAMAGYTDFMISQWLTEFVLVPLPLVILGRKRIHRDGIFWKSVLAKTESWECFR
ncbi:MAG: 6-phosphofructokinase [Chthoniobacteraceae bacterium]